MLLGPRPPPSPPHHTAPTSSCASPTAWRAGGMARLAPSSCCRAWPAKRRACSALAGICATAAAVRGVEASVNGVVQVW